MARPTPQQIRELAAAAIADERSIRRAYATPERVRQSTIDRVTREALRLGYEPPPGGNVRRVG